MLDERRVSRWLRELRQGRRSTSSVIDELRRLPTDHLGFARLDTHRRLRRGAPEAVLCEGKRPEHLEAIARRLMQHGELVLLTRLDCDTALDLQRKLPSLRYDALARLGSWAPPAKTLKRSGLAVVVSAGTSDIPVAEEAALTLELLGSRAQRLYDVGVAGLHRVLESFALLQRARVIIVAAGMEGALPSVVAGLVRCPIVAVPTSVGYGASFTGVAPLLAMLSSCAPGIGVVNIDNGFGAGYLAHTINRR